MTTCTPECEAEKALLVEALDKMGCSYNITYPCLTALKDYPSSWCLRCRALADTSPAQGKETADIETLREMVHAFYEGGRPITKEQLDAFCAVGGEEKE